MQQLDIFSVSGSSSPTASLASDGQDPQVFMQQMQERRERTRIAVKEGRVKPGSGRSKNLMVTVALLPTPDHNDGARGPAKVYDPKAKSQSGRTVNTLIGSGTGRKLRLQPAMTQWMMGYPDSWTEFPKVTPSGDKTASKPTATA